VNELELIRDFRAAASSPSAAARAAAVDRLTSSWEARRWRLVGRRRLLLGVALLIAALATGTAVGVGDRIVDLVRGKPAPTRIKEGPLSTWGPRPFPKNMPEEAKARASGFQVTGEWRGVLAVHTSAGLLTLWKAPARNGSVCWDYMFTNDDATRWIGPAEGGCDHPGWRSGDPWPDDRFGREVRKRLPRGRPTLAAQIDVRPVTPGKEITWLRGRAALGIAQVEIRFRNGTRRRIGVYDTFFAAEIPRESVVRRLVPLNPRGRAVPCNYTRLCSWPEGPPP
jgi:hypothetical protein